MTFFNRHPKRALWSWLDSQADIAKVFFWIVSTAHLTQSLYPFKFQYHDAGVVAAAISSIIFVGIHAYNAYWTRDRRPQAVLLGLALVVIVCLFLSLGLMEITPRWVMHVFFLSLELVILIWVCNSGVFGGIKGDLIRFAQTVGLEDGVSGEKNGRSQGSQARQRIADLLSRGVSDLRILVITGHADLAEDGSPIKEAFLKIIASNSVPKPTIRVLLLDPLTTFATTRMESINKFEKSAPDAVDENIRRFEKTRQFLNHHGVPYKIYTSRPLLRMYLGCERQRSDHKWGAIQTYLDDTPGTKTPLYEFWKRPKHHESDSFLKLAGQAFEFIWLRGFYDYTYAGLNDDSLIPYMAKMYGVNPEGNGSVTISELRNRVVEYARTRITKANSTNSDIGYSYSRTFQQEKSMSQTIGSIHTTGPVTVINGNENNTNTGSGQANQKNTALVSELERMVEAAQDHKESNEAIQQVRNAADLVKQGRLDDATRSLKSLGKWAADFASKIGANLVTDILKQ